MRLFFTIFLFPLFSIAQSIDYAVANIPDEFGKNSNAVVRLERMEVNIGSIKSMTAKYKRVVTILNESGNEHVMAVVGYDNGIKVKEINAKIFNDQGEVIERFKKSDFIDISAVDGGSLYTDSRMLLMNYLPIQYPYTVEFEYTISSSNTGTIPHWYFQKGFHVDVLHSQYLLKWESPELRPKFKENNFDGFTISKREVENGIIYTASDLKMLRAEALCPAFADIMPHILVGPTQFYYEGFEGTIRNWQDAGRWMNTKILSGQDILPQATIQKVRQLVSGVQDDLEKAKIIFNYVQENTRYISVQVGIGGIKPISATEVDNVKYGDCKGLSNYTKSLLAAVGVESYYVHVEAGDDIVDFQPDFASLAQGNHVILAVPYKDQYYWLDSTSQTIPFGFIADFTDDRNVLVITPSGGELQKTKTYAPTENFQQITGEYTIDIRGGISGNVNIKTGGSQYGNHYHISSLENLDIDKYYKGFWSNVNNLKLISYDFKNNEERIEFNEAVNFKAEQYGTLLNGKIMFVGNAFNNQQYVPPRYRTRHLPFQIQRGFFDHDAYRISLPEGYQLETLPEPVKIENEFGVFLLKYSVEENDKILVQRELLLNKGHYPKEKYSAFRSFMRAIAKHDKSKLIINKKA